MKINVSLKDPDGFSNSVDEAVRASVDSTPGLDEDEKEHIFETRRETVWKKLARFVQYQEYVSIEFDTDEGTAVVVPNTRS